MQGSTEASTSRALPPPAPAAAASPVPPSPKSSSKGKVRARAATQSQSWDELLRSGLAGGIAGCVAKTSVAPLDRVKILFQTGSKPYEKYSGTWTGVFRAGGDIYREAGIRGLLQGHSATLLRIFPYAGIKFMAYETLHRALMPTPESVTSPRLFVAGAASGVITVLFTYPLDLVRVRLAYDRRLPPEQLQGRSALVYSILKIYHEGDPPPPRQWSNAQSPTLPRAPQLPSTPPYFKNPSKAVLVTSSLFARFPILKFYRGFVVSLIGMVPYAGTSFLVYGYLKQRFAEQQRHGHGHGPGQTSTLLNLSCGAVAGAAAQTASYPFEVVRRRMQVGGILRPDRFFGFWETVQFIYSTQNGWRGFFVGLSIGYLKVVPLTAISFATWQSLKGVMGVA